MDNSAELERENWWEPYTWDRRGIGMSKIFDKDYSKDFNVYRRKLKAVRLYGLEGRNDFLTMRVCLEFRDFYLIFDRALHNVGEMKLINMKTNEQRKITETGYIPLFKKHKDYNPNPIKGKPPIRNAKPLEKMIEEYSGRTVSKLILRGNLTTAVGYLINEVLIKLSGEKYLQFGIIRMHKQNISRVLGSKKLDELCTLAVEANVK